MSLTKTRRALPNDRAPKKVAKTGMPGQWRVFISKNGTGYNDTMLNQKSCSWYRRLKTEAEYDTNDKLGCPIRACQNIDNETRTHRFRTKSLLMDNRNQIMDVGDCQGREAGADRGQASA